MFLKIRKKKPLKKGYNFFLLSEIIMLGKLPIPDIATNYSNYEDLLLQGYYPTFYRPPRTLSLFS